MAKFVNFVSTKDINDIMERLLEVWSSDFPGFDVDGIQGIYTKGKKNKKFPLKLHPIRYPQSVLIDEKVYIVEVFEEAWKLLNETQKQRCVYHVMCQIPEDAFDTSSKTYGKKIKPDSEVFIREHQRNGGSVNWLADDSKLPPLIPKK